MRAILFLYDRQINPGRREKDGGQQYQRYWGFYSNAARGKRLRDAAEDCESSEDPTADPSEDEDPDGWKKRRRISWAQLIRKVFEVDPMLCSCGERMRILSFLTDPPVVRQILRHLGNPSSKRPRGPPRVGPEPSALASRSPRFR